MGGPGLIDGEQHEEVDNFLPCKFVVDGIEYCSAENYFQCQKCVSKDSEEFQKVKGSGPGAGCWSAGHAVRHLRPDWENIKVRVMYEGNRAKFEQNPKLLQRLLSTKSDVKFFASTSFWCYWNGIIMQLIREEFRSADTQDKAVLQRLRSLLDNYSPDDLISL